MRIVRSVHLTAPIFVAVALFAVPSMAHMAPAQVVPTGAPQVLSPTQFAGIYRLTLTGKSHASQTLHLVVRLEAQGYTGVLLNEANESPLLDLRIEGDAIRASTVTNFGRGEMMLRFTDDGVAGTLTIGKQEVAISGERTA